MALLDLKSLFTLVLLEHIINTIIKQIFEQNLITTVFTKHELKKFLKICTENVHFSLNNDIYAQRDRVANGSTYLW